mmetsp:Transcript_43187/g.96930  ORF Transcript_43187/g.96930 Transcript_43187/m.96930 type:complete len:208 (+) Transcript_43187:309-932(+)
MLQQAHECRIHAQANRHMLGHIAAQPRSGQDESPVGPKALGGQAEGVAVGLHGAQHHLLVVSQASARQLQSPPIQAHGFQHQLTVILEELGEFRALPHRNHDHLAVCSQRFRSKVKGLARLAYSRQDHVSVCTQFFREDRQGVAAQAQHLKVKLSVFDLLRCPCQGGGVNAYRRTQEVPVTQELLCGSLQAAGAVLGHVQHQGPVLP